MPPIVIFTDLDGCLLNKADYRYDAAKPALAKLRFAEIPLILCSSKTQVEMQPLADELELPWPIVCENGGIVAWRDGRQDAVLGTSRDRILSALRTAHESYQFRSFRDLGVDGVMDVADLSADQAKKAISRQCTEPLLWDDTVEQRELFRETLLDFGLCLTQGGRFWHVSSGVTKGDGMRHVVEDMLEKLGLNVSTVAIGDSPIDQPMLDLADVPILIPQLDGRFLVSSDRSTRMIAQLPGAAGWNEVVTRLLDDLAL